MRKQKKSWKTRAVCGLGAVWQQGGLLPPLVLLHATVSHRSLREFVVVGGGGGAQVPTHDRRPSIPGFPPPPQHRGNVQWHPRHPIPTRPALGAGGAGVHRVLPKTGTIPLHCAGCAGQWPRVKGPLQLRRIPPCPPRPVRAKVPRSPGLGHSNAQPWFRFYSLAPSLTPSPWVPTPSPSPGINCTRRCPGAATAPCSGHGLCRADDGVCACTHGARHSIPSPHPPNQEQR